MSSWEQQIEKDIEWREAEMASLKLLLASAPTGSDRQRALLRACSAMLYAHYEGFCKACWALLLDAIKAEAPLCCDLNEPIAKRSLASVFKKLRGNTSSDNLWTFGISEFQKHLKQAVIFIEEIDTESNLRPSLAQKINLSVGLQCHKFDLHKAELHQLVERRNEIAHGEKMEIADMVQFQKFEHAAWVAMHDLAIAVVECLDNKSYLRPVEEPAMLI